MAVARDLPYLGCHFQVRWNPGDGPPAGSGFSEVVLPPFPAGAPAPGISAAASPALVVLRRGFLGSLDLYTWWNDTRLGLDKRERTLTVDLLDGEHGRVVCTWEFAGARPVQLDYSPLQALGASVLVETLTLTYATMTMK